MSREPLPPELTRQVLPRALRGYALGLDWKPVNGVTGDVAVFHRPDSPAHQVIVPVDTTLADYDVAVAEAVRKLAAYEGRPARDVLSHLLLPPTDLLGFREVSSDAEAGSLSFEHAVRFINGTRRLLLSAAHSALVPRTFHPRLSRGEAEEFLGRCRFGQTGQGSFVVNVACPLGEQLSLFGDPYARQVATLLLDTLDTLARTAEEGPADELLDPAKHRGISANLCESLLLLRPDGDRARLEVSVAWSRSRLPPSSAKGRTVELRQEAFAIAEMLAPRLRTLPQPRSARFFGFVEGLSGQPTPSEPRPSGEVRFLLFEKEGELFARADLSADDYAAAGAAHLAGALVSFRGVLHRLPRLNRIDQVTHFERYPLDDWQSESANTQPVPTT